MSLDGGCVWSRRDLMLSQLVGGSKQQHRSQQPAASNSGSTGMGPRLHHWPAQQTPDHWLQTVCASPRPEPGDVQMPTQWRLETTGSVGLAGWDGGVR